MRVLLLCSRSLLWRLSFQLSLNRHLLLLRGRLGTGALLWMMGPVLILIRVQARSLATRANLRWSLRLGLLLRRRALLTCLHGRICLRLKLIRSRTLKSQEQLLKSRGQLHLRREIELKRKLHHLTLKKTEKQVPKKKRTLKSLRDFPLQEIFPKWYRDSETSIFRQALTEFDIKNNIDGFATLLRNAANLIHNLDLGEDHFIYNLSFHCKQYCKNNPGGPEITIEKFDDYLYRWVMKVCPRALI